MEQGGGAGVDYPAALSVIALRPVRGLYKGLGHCPAKQKQTFGGHAGSLF